MSPCKGILAALRRRPARSHPALLTVAVALILAGGWLGRARDARAAGSSPVLMLTATDAFAGDDGTHLVAVEGAFNFDDLVQIPFTAAGLMVVQGTRFARYDVGGQVLTGTSPLVADGVDPTELTTLLGLGSPAGAPARLARVTRNGVSVVLPPEIGAGSAVVLLFAEYDSESFLSNPLSVVLP